MTPYLYDAHLLHRDGSNFSEQSTSRSDLNETSGEATALHSFLTFPFSSDEVYQQGLADLLAHGAMSGKTDVEKAETILRTQLFYFNRMAGQNLTIEDVRSHQNTVNSQNITVTTDLSPLSSNSGTGEARLLTFAELTMLIKQGKTDDIPNNKFIPETLNDAPPSASIALVRKKPWEIDNQF